jgi:predicted nucleotidyltransferase
MRTKKEISKEMKELLFANEDVIAAWEGGSAATGFEDECSDLDLSIICKDSAVEEMFRELEDWLEKNYGILNKFRVPEPAWHGFSQCYYQIENVPPLFYLDIAVIKKSLPDKFTESDRHGNAVVWFEKEKILDSTPSEPEKVEQKAKHFYKIATQSDFLTITEIQKAIVRKRYSEAFPVYYQFIARNLAILLNLKYRPEKVDFGLRYGYRDYNIEDFELVESLLKVASLEELSKKFAFAKKRFYELKKEFDRLCP